MKHSFYLAWKYLSHNKLKFIVVVLCLTLVSYLPIGLHIFVHQMERQLRQRSNEIPLLIGAKGSTVDLVLSSLYYDTKPLDTIPMSAAQNIDQSGLGHAVPLYIRFKARNFPIVGTTLDYFPVRHLRVNEGGLFARVGDSVIGSNVAKKLKLHVGSKITSTAENAFDLAGVYPLQMHVTGILKTSHTPDDNAIFVDMRTSWIIQGLGHGHKNMQKNQDSSVILKRDSKNIVANAKLYQFTKITPKNINSFHFHGDLSNYPASSIIVLPKNNKTRTILIGRFIGKYKVLQIVKPKLIIDRLVQKLFKVKNMLNGVLAIVLFSSFLFLILIFLLSQRLRQKELITMYKMGCSRLKITELVFAEISIVLVVSLLLITALILASQGLDSQLIKLIM